MDSDKDPKWLTDWSTFIQVLHTQFGPIDPTADAKDNLDNPRMCDNHHIVKYNVDFNCLAIQTGWDNSILWHHYYSGLAECIKDIIGQVGKPSTLTELKNLAHSINACHWEQLHKKSRSNKSNQSNTSKSDKKPQNSNSQPQSTASKPQQKQQNSNDKSNKSSSTSTPIKSGISNTLTKDGKLTQQEWQCCLTNNLCMYCGGVGHKASDCNKASVTIFLTSFSFHISDTHLIYLCHPSPWYMSHLTQYLHCFPLLLDTHFIYMQHFSFLLVSLIYTASITYLYKLM